MPRRKMVLRRVDPWSVLKFGFVINVCLFAVGMLGFAFLWSVVTGMGIIRDFCELATDIGLQECGLSGGTVFSTVLLLGLLGVVLGTGVVVGIAFLYNLISDLVGGITVSVYEEGHSGAGYRPAQPASEPAEAGVASGGERSSRWSAAFGNGPGGSAAESRPFSAPPAEGGRGAES